MNQSILWLVALTILASADVPSRDAETFAPEDGTARRASDPLDATTDPERPPPPTTYEEALDALDRTSTSENRARIARMRQEDLGLTHFGLGLWIRNNWIYSNRALIDELVRMGLWNADEMSWVIVEGYWCRLNGGELDTNPIPLGAVHRVCWGLPGAPRIQTCPRDHNTMTVWRDELSRKDEKHDRLAYVAKCPEGHVWIAYAGEDWRPPRWRETRRLRRTARRAERIWGSERALILESRE